MYTPDYRGVAARLLRVGPGDTSGEYRHRARQGRGRDSPHISAFYLYPTPTGPVPVAPLPFLPPLGDANLRPVPAVSVAGVFPRARALSNPGLGAAGSHPPRPHLHARPKPLARHICKPRVMQRGKSPQPTRGGRKRGWVGTGWQPRMSADDGWWAAVVIGPHSVAGAGPGT
ncbi:hypothetical protein GGTG_04378 [Gaeumannomyces tritici R3-111a-1]|uniref:Uncharacterized protein n=1 Tax=Gaeumannomyces tritici (strain R3-111a-1) TaxID=644352 RepID=J3NSX9_GAET3|nr:hypothetical protein GGTG_04378 [Gaeumannomyces tritici R3-111a-1]EJT79292.1 hypothetical protein GGTG_04378 [Gaeumannomyces tritici R3-111a-1]